MMAPSDSTVRRFRAWLRGRLQARLERERKRGVRYLRRKENRYNQPISPFWTVAFSVAVQIGVVTMIALVIRVLHNRLILIDERYYLIQYDPDLAGVVSFAMFLPLPAIYVFRDYISVEAVDRYCVVMIAVLIVGVFGFPFVGRAYLNGELAAAGYVKCDEHPIISPLRPGSRSLLPPQVWVLDAADCEPGDDWSREAYRLARNAVLDGVDIRPGSDTPDAPLPAGAPDS
jgi:hypothetical protein